MPTYRVTFRDYDIYIYRLDDIDSKNNNGLQWQISMTEERTIHIAKKKIIHILIYIYIYLIYYIYYNYLLKEYEQIKIRILIQLDGLWDRDILIYI